MRCHDSGGGRRRGGRSQHLPDPPPHRSSPSSTTMSQFGDPEPMPTLSNFLSVSKPSERTPSSRGRSFFHRDRTRRTRAGATVDVQIRSRYAAWWFCEFQKCKKICPGGKPPRSAAPLFEVSSNHDKHQRRRSGSVRCTRAGCTSSRGRQKMRRQLF